MMCPTNMTKNPLWIWKKHRKGLSCYIPLLWDWGIDLDIFWCSEGHRDKTFSINLYNGLEVYEP